MPDTTEYESFRKLDRVAQCQILNILDWLRAQGGEASINFNVLSTAGELGLTNRRFERLLGVAAGGGWISLNPEWVRYAGRMLKARLTESGKGLLLQEVSG